MVTESEQPYAATKEYASNLIGPNSVDKIPLEKAAIQNKSNQKAGTKRSADLKLDIEYLIMMDNYSVANSFVT